MEELSLPELSAEIGVVLAELSAEWPNVPEGERFGYLKTKLAPYPFHIQNVVFASFNLGRDQIMLKREEYERGERRLGFLWGVGFILILIALAFLAPNPTLWQYTLFRIVLALAAAGFTNYIEGMLNIKWKFIRAAGPLAVFVIVFFFSPAALVTNPPH